jgi:hypothetical protein
VRMSISERLERAHTAGDVDAIAECETLLSDLATQWRATPAPTERVRLAARRLADYGCLPSPPPPPARGRGRPRKVVPIEPEAKPTSIFKD